MKMPANAIANAAVADADAIWMRMERVAHVLIQS